MAGGCLDRVGAAVLLVAVAALLVGVVGYGAAGAVRDLVDSKVALERVELQRDREANLHREAMFQMWTASLAALLGSDQVEVALLAAVLGAVAAWGVIRWLERKETFRP
jgi:uncharacterized membrane protein YqjE